jgi:hypothetical protein
MRTLHGSWKVEEVESENDRYFAYVLECLIPSTLSTVMSI